MKTMKKVIALLLAAVMAIGLMATTAFAANDGTIKIENTTANQTYSAYQVFELTYSGNNVAYSYTKKGSEDKLLDALSETESPFALAASSTEGVYNVSLKKNPATGNDYSAAYISSWLTAHKTLLGAATASVTATGNTVTFSSLPYGYYYITSSLGSTVTLDSAKKDVTIVDKNQGPSWDNNPNDPNDPNPPQGQRNPGKVIVNGDGSRTTVNSANYGDTVNFNISVNATAYDGTELVTYYYITDTLGEGFTLNAPITVKVYPLGTDGKYSDTADTLVVNNDYTITTSEDGQSFEITVPFGEKYGTQAKIEVTYSAVVNADGEDVVIAGTGNPNTANFAYATDDTFDPDDPGYDPHEPEDPHYPNDPYDPEDPDNNPPYDEQNEKTTTTYVYALGIKKVDPKGNVLKGAEFSVKNGNTAITAVATDTAGVYKYSATGTVTQFSTDDNGILIIQGLEAGTYTVKEEVAPLGYNLLTGTTDVTAAIASTNTYTTTITTYYDREGNVVSSAVVDGSSTPTTVSTKVVPMVIVNETGTVLPSTGGMGTTILYIIGGLMVVAAGVLLITKKRMGQEG